MSRWRRVIFLGLALALALCLAPGARAGYVTVDIYAGYTYPTGAPFSNLKASFTSPDIMFLTDKNWYWFPLGMYVPFGADITGTFVSAGGTYSFGLSSDDGSALYVNGSQAIYDGGNHAPWTIRQNITLPAGSVPFRLTFFENGEAWSGVDLYLPSGVTYGTPLPPALVLFGSGLLGLAGWRRMTRG